MSFDLAFWVGPCPKGDGEAVVQFERLSAAHVACCVARPRPPAPELLRFLAEVTQRYPDLADEADGENAHGPFLYLGVVSRRGREVRAYLAERAAAHGLVAFDPQSERLLTAAEDADLREARRALSH
jgi:hypothetical protein